MKRVAARQQRVIVMGRKPHLSITERIDKAEKSLRYLRERGCALNDRIEGLATEVLHSHALMGDIRRLQANQIVLERLVVKLLRERDESSSLDIKTDAELKAAWFPLRVQ